MSPKVATRLAVTGVTCLSENLPRRTGFPENQRQGYGVVAGRGALQNWPGSPGSCRKAPATGACLPGTARAGILWPRRDGLRSPGSRSSRGTWRGWPAVGSSVRAPPVALRRPSAARQRRARRGSWRHLFDLAIQVWPKVCPRNAGNSLNVNDAVGWNLSLLPAHHCALIDTKLLTELLKRQLGLFAVGPNRACGSHSRG
jgi:hypothetical protein